MERPDPCAEPATSLTPDEAQARLRTAISAVDDIESVPLKQALGRILAKDLHATLDLPPFASSAMDGYALRHVDIASHPDGSFKVIGAALAGKPFRQTVGARECVRIFTGAVIPAGTDAVVMQEDVVHMDDQIRLTRPLPLGANIRPAGDELRAGERILESGERLRAAGLGLLASAGIARVPVVRKIRVSFFSTGDELVAVDEPLESGQIHDSNRYLVHALLSDSAVEAIDLGVVRDDPCALRETLMDASQRSDAIISTGGVSVGDADFVVPSLAELGRIDFWKVAIKPGKPLAFGRIGRSWFFGLPGNPVAVLVTLRQIVRHGLLRMMGAKPSPALRLKAVSGSSLKKFPGRTEFQRGVYAMGDQGTLVVTPCAGQGSHQLTGLSRANCLIVLPAASAGVKPGELVEIEPLADGLF